MHISEIVLPKSKRQLEPQHRICGTKNCSIGIKWEKIKTKKKTKSERRKEEKRKRKSEQGIHFCVTRVDGNGHGKVPEANLRGVTGVSNCNRPEIPQDTHKIQVRLAEDALRYDSKYCTGGDHRGSTRTKLDIRLVLH